MSVGEGVKERDWGSGGRGGGGGSFACGPEVTRSFCFTELVYRASAL